MIEYTVETYLESKESVLEKIQALDALISSMLVKLASGIETADKKFFKLEDGQMTIWTEYRSFDDLTKGVIQLKKIKQMFISEYHGGTTILRSKARF